MDVDTAQGSLQPSQVNAVARFARQSTAGGASPVIIKRPAGGGASARVAEEVAGLLLQQGVEVRGGVLAVVESKPLTIEGDADLMAQAVANLIENAMTHGGGSPRITLSVRSDMKTWEIAVSDNGPGIAEADRDKVLEPFARLDASRSTPGSGLGLAIVAAVARLHGASIAMEDAGPGLRVVLRGALSETTTAA